MKYRGFVIKHVERTFLHVVVVKSMGIFKEGFEDLCLSTVADVELAKRLIDDRIKRGFWQEAEAGKGATVK